MTIFLTTQYMEEADRLCQGIAIIDRGKSVAEGSPTELKAAIGADIITVRIARDEAFEQSRNRALEIARTVPGVSRASIFDEGVSAYTADGGGTLLEILRRLDAEKVPVHQVALAHPTLDEVFLQHTGRQMRVEEVKPMSRSFAPFRAPRNRASQWCPTSSPGSWISSSSRRSAEAVYSRASSSPTACGWPPRPGLSWASRPS